MGKRAVSVLHCALPLEPSLMRRIPQKKSSWAMLQGSSIRPQAPHSENGQQNTNPREIRQVLLNIAVTSKIYIASIHNKTKNYIAAHKYQHRHTHDNNKTGQHLRYHKLQCTGRRSF